MTRWRDDGGHVLAKTIVQEGYRILLPESLWDRFHVGDEVIIDQTHDGRVVISVVEVEGRYAYPTTEVDSPLGRQLREIRQRIVASGAPLLDWNELDREMAERRGER